MAINNASLSESETSLAKQQLVVHAEAKSKADSPKISSIIPVLEECIAKVESTASTISDVQKNIQLRFNVDESNDSALVQSWKYYGQDVLTDINSNRLEECETELLGLKSSLEASLQKEQLEFESNDKDAGLSFSLKESINILQSLHSGKVLESNGKDPHFHQLESTVKRLEGMLAAQKNELSQFKSLKGNVKRKTPEDNDDNSGPSNPDQKKRKVYSSYKCFNCNKRGDHFRKDCPEPDARIKDKSEKKVTFFPTGN